MPASTPARDVMALASMLASDPSPKVRAQAALNLGVICGAQAEAALVQAIRDEDPRVRGAVARALGGCGSVAAFALLCEGARDGNGFASRWAAWGARQVLAKAPAITFGLRGLVSRTESRQDEFAKAFQEAVLEVLLAAGRYDVARTMSFVEADGQARNTVHVEMTGEVATVAGTREQATAEVRLQAVAAADFVAWEGRATGLGKADPPGPPEPDEDEYTIRTPAADAFRRAVTAAGGQAAREMVEGLARPAGGERDAR